MSLIASSARRSLAALLLLLSPVAGAGGFDFEQVTDLARRVAAAPYVPPQPIPQWLKDLDYDKWRDIRFRPAQSLWRDDKLPFQVQFFHTGLFYDRAVSLHVVEAGKSRPLAFSPSLFDYGRNGFGDQVPTELGFAGFRIHAPIKTQDYYDEVAVFLGASYLRAVGKPHVYGLSARGLAIDTAAASGEEFPWFREFWLVKPGPKDSRLTLYALLDSPSVAGAYKFTISPGQATAVDVDSVLFPRKAIAKLGVAPLTSMFFYGENRSQRPVNDFRPEVHDSDGLLVAMANGEWLWRPLNNPRRLAVNSFLADSPRGFGLLQRDTAFDHYLDLEARYDLRPSAWVSPRGDWGRGRVELIQIPTANEMHDNIVAYWIPEEPVAPGKPLAYAYRLNWQVGNGQAPPDGRVVATYSSTYNPASDSDQGRAFVIEFEGPALAKLPPGSPVQAVVDVGPGARLREQQVVKNPVTGGWRLVFRLQPEKEGGPLQRVLDNGDAAPIELRAFLKHGGDVLTETWSYALLP